MCGDHSFFLPVPQLAPAVPSNVMSITLPPHHTVKLMDAMRLLASCVGHLSGVLLTGEPMFHEEQWLAPWASLGLFSGGWRVSDAHAAAAATIATVPAPEVVRYLRPTDCVASPDVARCGWQL